GLAEPGDITDVNPGHVFDQYWNAVRLVEDDVLDVFDLVALEQVGVAAVIDQADATHVHRLLAEADGAPANVDIGVADDAEQLGEGDVVGVELVEIDLDFELLGGSAPRVDLNDAFDCEQPTLDDPVLHRAQVGQAEVRWTDELITKDFAH